MPQITNEDVWRQLAHILQDKLKIAVEAMQTAVDYYDKRSWMMDAEDMANVLRHALDQIKGIG